MTTFIPTDFHPPKKASFEQYIVLPLAEKYSDLDVVAVNSSINIIKQTRGGSWPERLLTIEENRRDLKEHERLFEQREAFAYSILSKDELTCIGAIYLYPPNHPFDGTDKSNMPKDADVVVSGWVCQAAYDKGLYPTLYYFMLHWLQDEWPFSKPFIANRQKA